jgi:hypothetical protein
MDATNFITEAPQPATLDRSAAPTEAATWPDPRPLETDLRPVEPFCNELLPSPILSFAQDIAELMQVPLDFPAIASVLTIAGAVNRRAYILPKVKDTTWKVIPNLYGGIVAPPGFMKTPVMQAATRPLVDIENEWHKEFAAEMEEYEIKLADWKAHNPSTGGDKRKPKTPRARRLVVNDGTFEKIHELMRENPAGLLVICDELAGWLAQLERAGREGERGFFLTCWDGNSPHSLDRIGRGSIRVPATCLSMFGSIQPARFRSYLAGADGVPLADDGMIQRFQLLVWPDADRRFQWVDRPPNEDARRQFALIIKRMTDLDPNHPLEFHFDSEGQALFECWVEELEERVRGGQLSPLMAGHLAKYKSLFPSLALLFELADRAARQVLGGLGGCSTPTRLEVCYENAYRAFRWMPYLESHAARIYSLTGTRDQLAARQLADKILSRVADEEFTCRDIEHKDWKRLDSAERVRQACLILERADWLRNVTEKPTGKGGRPSLKYKVNPKVYDMPARDE